MSWTPTEDAIILTSVRELGHKWNKIATKLHGRTEHAIRNRYHRLQTALADQHVMQMQAEEADAMGAALGDAMGSPPLSPAGFSPAMLVGRRVRRGADHTCELRDEMRAEREHAPARCGGCVQDVCSCSDEIDFCRYGVCDTGSRRVVSRFFCVYSAA